MSHVYAARALVPGWVARGDGYFLSTASAAGLLTQIGSAPYAVTKHAAVAFAEWLSVTYGDQGVKVSVPVPEGVQHNMLKNNDVGVRALGADAVRGGAAQCSSPSRSPTPWWTHIRRGGSWSSPIPRC